jgi:hypothetical protein
VSRLRRSPAPPGRVRVICTGRADPGHGERLVKVLQFGQAADGAPAFTWRGPSPITPFARANGGETYDFRCGTCRRNPKLSRDRRAQIVMTAAAVHGWDVPITVDISAIERAL